MHLIVALAALAAPRPAEPRLVAPDAPVTVGEVVPLRIVAVQPGGVRIDGCAPVELERREGDAWKALPTVGCDKAIVATAVEKELTVSVPAPEPGEYRAVLSWGTGCTPNLPFAVAACAQTGFVRSAPFTVRSADAKP
ncbi:MAG: hypothetical protein ACOZNI_10245 [Myxococcota bacterium]